MSNTNSLKDLQSEAGALFGDDGLMGPSSYGNAHGEYVIAETEAALIDFTARCHVELTGSDCVKFLNNFCTNDLRTLRTGQGCEAFMTSVQGKVLAHLFIFVGEGAIRLESSPETEAVITRHLDKYLITEDVEIIGRTGEWGEFFITGPDIQDRIAALGGDIGEMQSFDHKPTEMSGIAVDVRRCDWTSQPGYLLLVSRNDLPAFWTKLKQVGLRPVGAEAFHALRIESRMPLDRIDITDENLAQEAARTERVISFSKGCYLGQEPIARIDALGHVNRELRGIRLAERLMPLVGDTVANREGEPIGQITSVAMSFRNDLPVAMAYVHRNYLDPGTAVAVLSEGQMIPGNVF